MTGAAISLDEAQAAIRHGAEYGAVYERLAEGDRAALAEWFVRTPGLPNLAARAAAKATQPSGELCPRCGGLLVRTGTCLTCQSCGESTGGCG